MLPPGANAGGPPVQTTGALQCVVIERSEVPRAIAASRGGDYVSTHVLQAIGQWMGEGFRPTQPKPRCAECDTAIESPVGNNAPEAFYIAIPTLGNGDTIAAAVCGRCTRKIGSDSLFAHCIEHFKKVWPKATVVKDSRVNHS